MRSAPRVLLLGTCLVAGGALLAACDGRPTVTSLSGTPTTDPSVTLATEPSPDGPVLTTGTGHTLYDFAPDTPGRSECITSVCVELWPPLLVTGRPTVGKGLIQGMVGTIRRPGGTIQVTYGGHPLYTWRGDTKAGMITGQALLNAGGYWYVVSPSGQQLTPPFAVLG